jgi:hypothetical protein
MSIAKNARASQVMTDIRNGKYTSVNKRGKFANFGSVVEDSLFAQQAEADRRLKQIQAQKAQLLAKRKFV